MSQKEDADITAAALVITQGNIEFQASFEMQAKMPPPPSSTSWGDSQPPQSNRCGTNRLAFSVIGESDSRIPSRRHVPLFMSDQPAPDHRILPVEALQRRHLPEDGRLFAVLSARLHVLPRR